jgi:hypothetical protein
MSLTRSNAVQETSKGAPEKAGPPGPQADADTAMAELVTRILGGDRSGFFQKYWRRELLHAPGAARCRTSLYGVDSFFEDLAATREPPFVAVGSREGARYFAKYSDTAALRAGIDRGEVASIKLNRIWHAGNIPHAWGWMRTLFARLYETVGMTYLDASRSEDCDLFLAGPSSSLGSHYDATDVFTLQLAGERRWRVDARVDTDRVFSLARARGFRRDSETPFGGTPSEIVLRPGDALYVPAFCVHHVTGVTWSLSLSLGVRAFNEIDVLEHLLERLRRSQYFEHGVLASWPLDMADAHVTAKLQLLERVRALLGKLELMAQLSAALPLALPEHLPAARTGERDALAHATTESEAGV